jgi:hypothetical protein
MTTAKTFASKASIAFVAAAMLFSMIAPAAQAQSSEDMQKMISDLMAQIASLQSKVGTGASASGYTFTRDLKVGSTGADVKALQMFLNGDADTRVAATGAGSAGMETETFGPATAAAVSKFQVKYRADILAPANLVNPTGYFGASSRAKANALSVKTTPTTPGTDDEDEDTTDEEDEDNGELGGEASLDNFEVDSASDDTVEEGSTDSEIGMFTVEFADGDASISRLDVALTKSTGDAWDAFETISLWVDGEMVAEADASAKNDYLGDEDDGIIRFSGLDIVAMEDEEVEITVGASMQDNLDSAELGTWTVGADSLRFFDADGVATTETGSLITSDTDTFTVEVAGADDEIIVKTSSNDPDATTLQLEDDSKSDEYTVFTFDIDTDDSTNDIELTEVVVTVTVSSSTYNNIVDDAELVIAGVTIDDVTVTNGASSTATLTFDVDNDVVIEAGERVAADLNLTFKSLSAALEGTTVEADVVSGGVDGEGADDVSSTGAASGDTHTLRTQGISVTPDEDSAVVTTGDNATDDYATYKISVEVTAFEQDVFISTNPATSTTWSLVNGAGASAVAGTRSVTLTSTADENAGYFEIKEGETETITVTVTYTPAAANTAARLVLGSLLFDDAASAPAQTWTASPVTDYRTDVVTLVN